MKQILQSLKTGVTEVFDVPCPVAKSGQLLIRTSATLVSTGTERMLADFGKASYLDKARQQPDKVKQVLDKIKTDGLIPTLDAVRSKLDQPLPLGYCNAGVVLESVVAFELADALLDKTGGDTVGEVVRSLQAYVADVARR